MKSKWEKWSGHPLPCFSDDKQKISYGNVLLAGDAGHLMDPLTGEGIYYAIRSGRLAAEAIVQSKEKGGRSLRIPIRIRSRASSWRT